jgi:hypothetical protein
MKEASSSQCRQKTGAQLQDLPPFSPAFFGSKRRPTLAGRALLVVQVWAFLRASIISLSAAMMSLRVQQQLDECLVADLVHWQQDQGQANRASQ